VPKNSVASISPFAVEDDVTDIGVVVLVVVVVETEVLEEDLQADMETKTLMTRTAVIIDFIFIVFLSTILIANQGDA